MSISSFRVLGTTRATAFRSRTVTFAHRDALEEIAGHCQPSPSPLAWCYKKFDAYSGLTVRWAEMGFAIWDEFRGGNVPPSYGNLEALTESITYMNEELGITDVWVRSDLSAGQFPSNRFGVNAAWWTMAVLAYNLHALLEKLALPKGLAGSRFKRLRFHLINVPARPAVAGMPDDAVFDTSKRLHCILCSIFEARLSSPQSRIHDCYLTLTSVPKCAIPPSGGCAELPSSRSLP